MILYRQLRIITAFIVINMCVLFPVPSNGWDPSISKLKIEETSLT